MKPLELTLVVAATRSMGIGAKGTMPWKGLRKEMQYFARVTTRVPPTVRKTCTCHLAFNDESSNESKNKAPSGAMNAVIMGRKTWDSIPAKFRPLKDRLNIVISRSTPDTQPAPPAATAEPVRVSSVEKALQYAREHCIGRVFVMGGAQIYSAALELPEAKRVLLTSLDAEFDCDVFFPLDLRDGGKAAADGWARRSTQQLREWTGQEDVSDDGQEEAGIKYEFQLWERE